MSDVYGHDFFEISPSTSTSISSTANFANDIKFTIEQPPSVYINGKIHIFH